ncbi:MAG: hypothetical protein CMJ39_05805 [Phycisphaerae bacterium]|nr:hypothetical protein [Phycisphaerae bacterium]
MGESRQHATVMQRLMRSAKITLVVIAPLIVLLWAIGYISLTLMIVILSFSLFHDFIWLFRKK